MARAKTPPATRIKAPPAKEDRAETRAGAPHSPDFPIVGIGCSAGGLEALEKFLSHVPVGCGMAFVIIQHLAPDHESALPDLLQRATSMKVVEAKSRMAVRPDCVYVIPPGKDIALLHGVLHLLEPSDPRGLRLPVDFFLRTLAQDQQHKAIGVILSGMGSDGVLGLRAIKEVSGLTLAQDPASATSDSMPRSAIEAGVIDIIAPAEDLPSRIAAYLKYPSQMPLSAPAIESSAQDDLEKIVVLLRDRTGNDFSLYKTNTLVRRIERRIALHQISDLGDYVRHLRGNPQELDLLFKELLIGVTSFFRDAEVWESLRDETARQLLAQHAAGKPFRAWVPACSSGEEAYSLAITLKEAMAQTLPGDRIVLQIYATDLDPEAIEKARKGFYPKNIAADVPPELLARHFVEEPEGYRIRKEIREMVVFAPQNIISDPPFTKLNIVSCRNLLIYFRPHFQKRLLPLLHYALSRDGLLLLGKAETVGHFTHLFAPVNAPARLFKRLDHPQPLPDFSFSAMSMGDALSSAALPHAERAENIGRLTDQLMQQNFAPAAVLVNEEGDILYISGRTGKYLEPAAGKVNINIHAMAREGLREALTGMIGKALRESQPVQLSGLQIDQQIVNVTLQAIDKPEALRGRVIVVFHDIGKSPPGKKGRKAVPPSTHNALLLELLQTRETLQATHEEMQTSLEELKSSNEELQSTNEELQSTNEELTTSKEEMQSMNEELQTVNAELQSKVDDLNGVKSDMANLLNSTEVATIFLDNDMRLRRFTPHATSLFKLIPGDVGRPFSHVVTDLDYPGLEADAQDVLRTLIFREGQAATRDGRWYRVRIMPYRTQDNVIDGVVATFIDISELKKLEAELKRGRPA
jgi:two-component system CheB/CheR fusion protein